MRTATLAGGLAAGLLLAAAAGSAAAGGPRYGVCRQQITDYVQQRLKQTPTRIEVQSYAERSPPRSPFDPGSALVYVQECRGFHAFEIRATESLCEHIPHYGASSGSYVRYEGAFEGCRPG